MKEVQYECNKCKDTGTIHDLRWVEDETYTYNGKPMPRQVASIELCECHYQKLFEKYNASSGMSKEQLEHTFKNATIDDENRPHFEIVIDFIKNIQDHMKNGDWLYIFGDEQRSEKLNLSAYGTGKTYLLDCIANALTTRKISALYVKEEKLFADIKSTYEKNSEESEYEMLQRYYKVPILLIDDLFTAPYKDWAEGKLFSILDKRSEEKKVTIITSNYALNRIKDRLTINGPKIASRIMGHANLLEMIGKDRRLKVAKSRKDKRREWA